MVIKGYTNKMEFSHCYPQSRDLPSSSVFSSVCWESSPRSGGTHGSALQNNGNTVWGDVTMVAIDAISSSRIAAFLVGELNVELNL